MSNWKDECNYRHITDEGGIEHYYIIVDKQLVEVSKEIYEVYASLARRERYIKHEQERNRVFSLEQMQEDELQLEYLCSAMVESSEDRFISSLNDAECQRLARQLPNALGILSSEEANIINLHFYKGISMRQIARMRGTSHQAMSKRMETILRKIKKYF